MLTQETTSKKDQYTLWQILGIGLAGGAPMWLLSWVAYPALSAGLPRMDAGLLRLKLLTVGLIWQFVLAMIILYREEGNIRLGTISRRFRLNHPVSAGSGETRKALWWWIVPLSVLVALIGMAVRPMIVNLIATAFPSLTGLINTFESKATYDPALFDQWVGAWGIPSSILTGLVYAFSANRFRSTWFSINLHSGQSVFMLFLVLGLVLGLA